MEYQAKKYNKEPNEKELKEWKEKQRIYWISFGVALLVIIISTVIILI